jgi:hypothetical protein
MAAKDISVKKYVARLSGEEREQLEALIRKGKSAAQRLLKARILLKADVSEAGEMRLPVDCLSAWKTGRIVAHGQVPSDYGVAASGADLMLIGTAFRAVNVCNLIWRLGFWRQTT